LFPDQNTPKEKRSGAQELFALVFHPKDFLFEISLGGETGFPSKKVTRRLYENPLNKIIVGEGLK